MISRYSPTYSYSDLIRSWSSRLHDDMEETLIYQLAKLYYAKHIYLLRTAGAALYVLLKAYDRPGGVLTSAYNDLVVPEVIRYAGYYPVFADIDYKSLQMNLDSLGERDLSEITVIVPVHLFGIPCEWGKVERIKNQKNILVIEDVAPAFGAEYQGLPAGSLGDASIISFHHTKIISAEIGGVLVTNDDDLAHKIDNTLNEFVAAKDDLHLFVNAFIRKLFTTPSIYPITHSTYRLLHGGQMYHISPSRSAPPKNFFTRCPKFSSALILNQIEKLDWNLSRRKKLAEIYQEELSNAPGLSLPIIPEDCSPAWMQFPILVNDIRDKEKFYKYMQRHGIDLGWTWRYSCAESFGLNGFPNTQKAAKTLLGLPTYPSLTDDEAHYICDIAKAYRFDH